jgi:hypothetical protein
MHPFKKKLVFILIDYNFFNIRLLFKTNIPFMWPARAGFPGRRPATGSTGIDASRAVPRPVITGNKGAPQELSLQWVSHMSWRTSDPENRPALPACTRATCRPALVERITGRMVIADK